ncbi:hypothetical protein D3C80_1910390 [compost metagenome]
MRRHEELALATDLHAHEADIPALDHSAGADHALERLAAVVGRVELCTVLQVAVVVGGDQSTLDRFLAVAQLNVFNPQFVAHGVPSISGREFGGAVFSGFLPPGNRTHHL